MKPNKYEIFHQIENPLNERTDTLTIALLYRFSKQMMHYTVVLSISIENHVEGFHFSHWLSHFMVLLGQYILQHSSILH